MIPLGIIGRQISRGEPLPIKNTITVGSGSGNLVIDGADAKYLGKENILINPGSYGTITIKDFDKNYGFSEMTILNSVEAIDVGKFDIYNVENVVLSGAGVPGVPLGFNIHNSSRGIDLSVWFKNLTIQNISFKNLSSNAIYGSSDIGYNLNYLGTPETRLDGLKILNNKFDATGNISLGGYINGSEDSGLFTNLEVAYNYITNVNGTQFCEVTNVDEYDIHHNFVNSYNNKGASGNTNHNGIFKMTGFGHFHDNLVQDSQGNMIRAWVFSRGTTPKTALFYNNIHYDTYKYGGIEIQDFAAYYRGGQNTYINAKVYNNTVLQVNKSHDWDGVVLDFYGVGPGGTLEFYNNLGGNLWKSGSGSMATMINYMSSDPQTVNTNNHYFTTVANAVEDTVSFVSKVPGCGAILAVST